MFYIYSRISNTREELEKNKIKLKNIFETIDVAIWSHDLKTNKLLITKGIEKLYGRKLTEFYHDHELWKKVIVPEDQLFLYDRDLNLREGKSVTSIYRILRPTGEIRWIQDRGIPTLDEEGNFVDFTSIIFDITDRKESEDRYQTIVEMSPNLVAIIANHKIEYINEAGCQIIGTNNPHALIGQSINKIITPNMMGKIEKQLKNINFDKRVIFEIDGPRSDGKWIEMEVAARFIHLGGKKAVQIIGRDITEQKKSERIITHMAYYDELTGLPNRNMFRQELYSSLLNKDIQRLAILFLDLDRFKIINDTKGHSVGDLILKRIAQKLENIFQNEGLISRQGGDEFIVMLLDVNRITILDFCQRIINQFSSPIILDNEEFYITVSIGISLYPEDGVDEETLIKHADTAMYHAKDKGKNNFQFYHSYLIHHTTRMMELETSLRKAIQHNQFMLHYQPQIELSTGTIVGAEALLRWYHPEHGIIAPNEFIPLAEETGLIVPLGKWILKTACLQNKQWQNAGKRPIPVSVNVSVRQLQDEDFVEYIKLVLKETQLEPQYLDLEITESIMQDIESSIKILTELKGIGVFISIDDFGKGFSSLSYLRYLPIDQIKIDKSFVDDITVHASAGQIVKTIIDLGHNLDFGLVAEGIENEAQIQFLVNHGCQKGQGFFFSKPITAKEMEKLFVTNQL
ncbi:EAL domain-containing protein [Bacillus sp. DNRA2]|uniref:sensor domain-containing protein n=1 Tax=Bacillus sp. DNRA2 TaxID=2723053 RepID=UPI00145CF381|nr:EAL domain-containing protein [Bacillus sp. DNRA2]NMD71703.1 EAL domain-containing protein [Bacillus sp. DNRA2]